ncbi:PARP-domain-containing protein [Microthyrium microscopicum]|uniref:Poly [ADP-ribose] polymerase n=1 Tax=Microthyrium microscopicum TaxID=703497 RepID=A0A6A6UVL8_9PEZI|nr:PARP-domain-containing protein [Microthyrium microscopicum]
MAPKKRAAAASAATTNKRAKKDSDATPATKVKATPAAKSKAKDTKKDLKKETKAPVVPVDENCHFSTTHHVYIDDEGLPFDVALNQTNVGDNNNKFYRIQLLEDAAQSNYYTWTRWGRVGERGQSKALGGGALAGAMKEFEKKFKEKTGLAWDDRFDDPKPKKYTFLEKSYEPVAGASKVNKTVAEPTIAQPVQKLMQLIFNAKFMTAAMEALDYDVAKLPLGKLSMRTIEQAYQTLKDLSVFVVDAATVDTNKESVEELTNRYYTLIPHAFGRRNPPLLTSSDMVKRETELLDSLIDMKKTSEIMNEEEEESQEATVAHPLDRQYQGLGMEEVTPLDPKTKEFKELAAYLIKTQGATHGALKYQIEDIFRIERQGEFQRFDSAPHTKVKKSNRRLLWHGSLATNFGGILSTGLRIAPPEAPVSGYMFDKGIYLADMSSKSANYCRAGVTGGTGLLLLCEAELGDPMMEYEDFKYDAGSEVKKAGKLATWGKGKTGPLKWKDGKTIHKSLKGISVPDVSTAPGPTGVKSTSGYGGLEYNEYIVYDVAQVRLRYLFRVKM